MRRRQGRQKAFWRGKEGLSLSLSLTSFFCYLKDSDFFFLFFFFFLLLLLLL